MLWHFNWLIIKNFVEKNLFKNLYLLRKEIIFSTLCSEYQIDRKLIFSALRSYEKKYRQLYFSIKCFSLKKKKNEMHSAWFVMQTSRSCAGSVRIGISLANQSENTWPNRTNELSSEARMFPNYTHGTRAYTISNKSEALGTSVRYAPDRTTIYVVVYRVQARLYALIVTYFDSSIVTALTLANLFPFYSYSLTACSIRREKAKSERIKYECNYQIDENFVFYIVNITKIFFLILRREI